MSRRRAGHRFLWGVLLFVASLTALFAGCVRRGAGVNCARQKELYRQEVARSRGAIGEYLLLTQCVALVRKNFLKDLSHDNLFLGTIRKCRDGCAKKLSISEGPDGVRVACGDNAVSVHRPIADDRALEEAFREVRRIVRECATASCGDRIDDDYEGFVVETLARSLDRRSAYWDCEDIERARRNENKAQLGLRLAELDGANVTLAPLEPTPACNAGIKEGDRILKIGDRSVEDMTAIERFESEHGVPGTQETIWIMRDGFDQPKPVSLTREIVETKEVEALSLEEGIGYIQIHSFGYRASDRVAEFLHWLAREKGGLKGLVLDLRSNGGGLVPEVYSVLDRFIDSGATGIIKTRSIEPSVQYARSWRTYRGFPVAVLVNAYTISGAEIVARTLQENGRGRVVGVPTRGAVSIDSAYPLRNGSILWLPTGAAFTGKGYPLDNQAVRPDIVVEKGDAGDPQLDTAVAYLRDAISRPEPAAK